MTSSSNTPEDSNALFAPRTPHIIGRTAYLKAIRDAITDRSGRSHVLYFVGPGGIGKTRLLEEVGRLQTASGFRWTGIIDLYHAEYHSPGGLRAAIIDGLDPDNHYFQEYRALRTDYERKLYEQVSPRELEEVRRQQDPKFQEEYSALAQRQRLVLCFDTVELLQYESELVQQIRQTDDVDTAIKAWILEQGGRLPNTVILLAGRPSYHAEEDFKRYFSDKFKPYILAKLTKEETNEYLNILSEQSSELANILTSEIQDQLFQITWGRPIYIALLIDLILHGDVIKDIFPSDMQANIDEDGVGKRLVERLLALPEPFGQMIDFMVRARKGLDIDLLKYLAEDTWSEDQIQNNIAYMREFAFVKTRPQTNLLFLHDEVYDLFDRYFKGDSSYRRGYERFVEYYREARESAAAEMAEIVAQQETDPQKREDLQAQKREAVQAHEATVVTSLYYELQLNPAKGYNHYFARWDEDAIKSHEVGLDMRLRDEALRFLNRYAWAAAPFYDPFVADQIDQTAIERDSALRWVKRYLSRGDFDRVVEVAQALLTSKELVFDWEKVTDPLYKADLLRAWGEALVLSSAPEEKAKERLDQSIELLNKAHDWTEDQRWWHARILGQAYNYLGYLHRVRGRYGQALEEYKRALPYFQKAGIRIERATTLNNLAFLVAQLGRVTLALHHIEQALELRRELGHQYPLALSINTRGLIHTLQDHPMWGVNECREALRMCEDLEEQRGIGLARIGLGFALRKRGDQWKIGVYPYGEALSYFEEAFQHLNSAVELFSKKFEEPVRLWEAYNELGSLYCDWGWLMRKQDDNSTALDYYERSIRYHEQALNVAQKYKLPFQIADTYDDLAQIYGDQSFLLKEMNELEQAKKNRDRAEAFLIRIEQTVPSGFRLMPDVGFSEAKEPGEAYWLASGKIHLRRGTWAFRDAESKGIAESERQEYLTRGIREFCLSVIYFQRYWPQSFALEQTLNRLGSFLQQANAESDWAREKVQSVAAEYDLDLNFVDTMISDILGL